LHSGWEAASACHVGRQEFVMGFVVYPVRMVRTGIAFLFVVFAALVPSGAVYAQTPLKFLLDWKIEGPAAPVLVAIDKGYFKAENLNVSVDVSEGSIDTIKKVASGEYNIGFGDINALIRFRDQNPQMPVNAVFIVYNKPAYSIVGRKSRGIAKPKDLEGKKLGAPANDSAFAQWKTFAKLNDVDESKVAIENIGLPVREPMLAAGQIDAATGASFNSYVNLKDRGVPANDITVMLMSDYGLDLYGSTILVGKKFADENPEVVKAFLRAFTKGLKDTVTSTSRSVDSVIKRDETLRKDIELERLKIVIRDSILTPEVKAAGYGGIDPERLARSIEQIGLGYEFKDKPKAVDVFDAFFLPSLALRKAN
jgi:NitT/TauT family transport system substrate-binding protein